MNEHLSRVEQLVQRLHRLSPLKLGEVERLVAGLESHGCRTQTRRENGDASSQSKDWPHAPLHRLNGKGKYIVTAGTLNKQHFFGTRELLDLLESGLLAKAAQYSWHLEAWAVFANHYHFVGHALDDASTLRPFLAHLHADTARDANLRDAAEGRQVWCNFWETELTYEKSYLARLNYVYQNPVRHGLVLMANQYRWCSAAWFERTATPAQVKTIYSFKTDRIRVIDDFDVLGVRQSGLILRKELRSA
jgi:putative transposase